MSTPIKPFAGPKYPVIIHGPAGCGKTTMIDLFQKFFECANVIDGWSPKDGSCPFEQVKEDTLYITNDETMGGATALHGIMHHHVAVASFYDVLAHMSKAKGQTYAAYAEAYSKRQDAVLDAEITKFVNRVFGSGR